MIGRLLSIDNPYHLSIHLDQLEFKDKKDGEVISRPMEDISTIILNHPNITFSQAFIQKAASLNISVIFCDFRHHPASMLFHLDTNQVQNERFRAQVSISESLKKQLWQQTVIAKIKNQASVLAFTGNDPQALLYISKQVKSGDSTNEEAQAARRYWPKLFSEDFTREREGIYINPALNYGYAILRAATARALSGAGLLPTLGIHHHNKYNAFCLADDIMEPYRPFIDRTVWEMWQEGMNCSEIGKEEKARLISTLLMNTSIGKVKRPLQIALTITTASLNRCFLKEDKRIMYPVL
jgi:CRISPR-associated protein Cas1